MTYASFYAVSQDSWDDYRRKMKEVRPVNDAGLGDFVAILQKTTTESIEFRITFTPHIFFKHQETDGLLVLSFKTS